MSRTTIPGGSELSPHPPTPSPCTHYRAAGEGEQILTLSRRREAPHRERVDREAGRGRAFFAWAVLLPVEKSKSYEGTYADFDFERVAITGG